MTGLRGLAACAVMLGHYLESTPVAGLPGAILAHSYNAVDLFFVLSGFVLAMVYEDSFDGGRSRPFGRFLGHRLARLYPLYALTTLVSFALVRSGFPIYGEPTSSLPALASNLFMVQEWGWPSDSLNGPGWSISTEWAANLLFPALALLFLRLPMRWSVLVVAASFAGLAALGAVNTPEYWGTPIIFQAGWLRVPGPLLGCPMEFALGMFCWRLRSQVRWTRHLGRTPVLMAVLAAIFGWMLLNTLDVWFVALACILVVGLSYESSSVSRALGIPPVRWLGTISFSLYLVHAPLMTVVPWLLDRLAEAGAAHPRGLANAAVMASAIGVAALSFYAFERPSQRWLRRL